MIGASPTSRGQAADRERVLFVDDDRQVRDAFVRAVASDFDVDQAAEASVAIELADSLEYDVVVTDLLMPGMDGIALIQHLLYAGSGAGFVLVTGAPSLELPTQKQAVRRIGEILRKPWDQDELRMVLRRAAARARRKPSTESKATTLRVLVVEDDEFDSALIRRHLSAAGGFSVVSAERLAEAMDCLRRTPIDVVIADLALPDACGLDSVTRIRRAFPRVPVVVMSGMDDENLARQVAQAGAQNFLVKDGMTGRSLAYGLWCAVETHRREMDLVSKALRDPLTGVANRDGLASEFKHLQSRASRSGANLACLVLDLDFFKTINDTMGHAAGDAVLKAVANSVQQAVRDADVVARLGGDEFCVLAEVDDPSQALLLRDRLRSALAEPIEFHGSELTASASVGVSVLSPCSCELEQLIRSADRDMYSDKGLRRSLLSPPA